MERSTFAPLLVLVCVLSAAIVLAGLSQRYSFMTTTWNEDELILRTDGLTGSACVYLVDSDMPNLDAIFGQGGFGPCS